MEKTWANSSLLNSLTRYSPNTKIEDGIKIFVKWYKNIITVKKVLTILFGLSIFDLIADPL